MPISPVTTVRPRYDACLKHYKDAAALWALRTQVSSLSNYGASDLQSMEEKIASHINELLVVPDTTWEICIDKMISEEPGFLFVAAVVAFRSYDHDKIKRVIDAADAEHARMREIISALGWMPSDICEPWVEKFLYSKNLSHKYMALGACSVRRLDPGDALTTLMRREDCMGEALLYARCLRLVGELKRQDLKSDLLRASEDSNESIRFWAIWSLMLLGEHYRVDALKPFVMAEGPYRARAINIAFRLLPGNAARQWIAELSQVEGSDREVIRAIAALGDPKGINWLITKMRDVPMARLAAEAFYHITGIGINEHNLGMDVPDLAGIIPGDGPDKPAHQVAEDEHLPWPDVDKVGAVWQQYGEGFRPGQRYFLGARITRDALERHIKNSTQRLRNSAAIEMSLLDSYMPYVNVGAWFYV